MGKKATAVGAVLGIVAGVVCALALPQAGLSVQAAQALGILVWAVVWWVLRVLPEMATAFIMAVLFVAVAGIPIETVFASFSGETWWLLVAAFALGMGMKESGLTMRIAHAVLRKFAPRFKSQVAALMASGTVLGPFIPSMSAKLAVLEPLAMGIGESLGYKPKSREMNGLFLAVLTGVRTIGPCIISASVIGYALQGFYPEDVQQRFNMVNWFLASLPWFIVATALNFVAIVMLYGPKGEKRARRSSGARREKTDPAATASGAAASGAAAETSTDSEARALSAQPGDGKEGQAPAHPSHEADLGPMTSREKRMLAIILATVALWILEPLHGISSTIVALAAVAAMFAFGVCTLKDFRRGINWENLLFIGTTIGLASVFSYAGIDTWVINLVGPFIEHLAFSPYVFVAGIAVMTILLRFVIVSEMAYVNIFMAFMTPMAISLGINPWIVGFVVYTMVNPWFMMYQNPIYMAAFYSVDGRMVDHAPMAAYCALYLALCFIALMVAVPFWQVTGVWSL